MTKIENIIGEVSYKTQEGSSRIVYFPINKRTIILDGIETKIETVLKVAKPHFLEKETGKCEFGKYQNKTEASLSSSDYSIFKKNSDNSFTTNNNGILSTVISYDPEYNWVEMVRLSPITIRDFCIENTTEDYPAGLYLPDVKKCMLKFFSLQEIQEGEIYPEYIEFEKYNLIIQHPWLKQYFSLLEEIGLVSVDFVDENLGVLQHPVTGKKRIAICDYGCTQYYRKNFERC